MSRTPLFAALAATLMLGSASGVQAQAATPGPHHAGAPDKQAWRDAMKTRMEAHERQRAQDLRTVLRLRPDQEAALTAFLAHRQRPDMKRDRPRGDGEAMTTAQRLDEMTQRDSRMAAMRQQHVEKLRAFYAALSPEQKQTFDALMRLRGPGGRGGPHGMHGMHGHEGPGGRGGAEGGPPPR
jgi:hypothetical protein